MITPTPTPALPHRGGGNFFSISIFFPLCLVPFRKQMGNPIYLFTSLLIEFYLATYLLP